MHTDAAIIGVGQSAYTRRPQPGQSTHTFIRDAAVAALDDVGVDAREVDGMAVASFSLAPHAAVDLAWKLGLSLRWLVQENNEFATFVADDDLNLRLAVKARPDGGFQYLVPQGTGWKPLFDVAKDDALTTNPVGFGPPEGAVLYDLGRYDEWFEDKLALFAELVKNEPVTWKGTTRTPLANQMIYPRIESGRLSTWVRVGGSPFHTWR